MSKQVKLLFTILAIVAGTITLKVLLSDQEAESDGTITFILIDASQEEVINEEVDFHIGDTIFDIINREYEVVCADEDYKPDPTCSYNSPYGKAILEINDVTTDWYSSFLALYINNQYANYGVSKLPYNDGDTIRFSWTPLS